MTSVAQQIVATATQILERTISPVLGCRKIASLSADLDLAARDHPAMLIIRAIDSESDEFPFGDERKTWAAAALVRLDADLRAYVNRIQPSLDEACRQIVQWLRPGSTQDDRPGEPSKGEP